MSNENKDAMEMRCLDETIKNCPQLKGFEIDKGERPDFILKQGNTKIGIEHFLVDTLLKEQTSSKGISYGSVNRCLEKEKNILFNKYTIKDILEQNDSYLSDMKLFSVKKNLAESLFDLDIFHQEFERVIDEHLQSIEIYKSKNIDKIGFLCEIYMPTYPFFMNVLIDGVWTQSQLSVILTKKMWAKIQPLLENNIINYFIITVMDFYGYSLIDSLFLEKDSNPTVVDAFDLNYQCSNKDDIKLFFTKEKINESKN